MQPEPFYGCIVIFMPEFKAGLFNPYIGLIAWRHQAITWTIYD